MKRKTGQKSIARHQRIGARVRYMREYRGLSLTDVCKRLDEPKPGKMALSRWETGQVAISVDRIEQLARIFRVEPGDLLQW
jgi:transcriptional regulator with XRE-family HTH domain